MKATATFPIETCANLLQRRLMHAALRYYAGKHPRMAMREPFWMNMVWGGLHADYCRRSCHPSNLTFTDLPPSPLSTKSRMSVGLFPAARATPSD